MHTSSWIQWLAIGMRLRSQSGHGLLFINLPLHRKDHTKWIQVFPQVLQNIMDELGVKHIKVFSYGYGAGLWLMSLPDLDPNVSEGLHVVINPEIPGYSRFPFGSVKKFLSSSTGCHLISFWKDISPLRLRKQGESRFQESFNSVQRLDLRNLDIIELQPDAFILKRLPRDPSNSFGEILFASDAFILSLCCILRAVDRTKLEIGIDGSIELKPFSSEINRLKN